MNTVVDLVGKRKNRGKDDHEIEREIERGWNKEWGQLGKQDWQWGQTWKWWDRTWEKAPQTHRECKKHWEEEKVNGVGKEEAMMERYISNLIFVSI